MQAVATAEFIANIPAPIRQRLKLRAGTVMDFDEEAPFLKAVPATPACAEEPAEFQSWLQSSAGLAGGKYTTAERMAQTREEILADMMSCVGIAKTKGSFRDLTSAGWLEETRGPVELPPEA